MRSSRSRDPEHADVAASLLALLSAVLYGAGDFIGGLTARRISTVATVLLSQFAGLVILIVIVLASPAVTLTRADAIWGASAGLAGGVGVALLYRALAVGSMAIVAPMTAICAVAIPAIADWLGGARLPLRAAVGMGIALAAIVLVSQGKREGATHRRAHIPPGVGTALVSGVAIGCFFLALARTAPGAGLWPLLVARTTSVVLFALLALATRTSMRVAPGAGLLAAAGGILDMFANAVYVIATRGGPLSLIVTLASLYPASTVILARVVLGERLTGPQTAGVLCALVAVAMIVA
jgi:uncharacterized membrane protein